MLTLFNAFVPLLLVASAFAIENTVYIITNAETPSLHRPGLTPIGHHRAGHCIPEVFGNLSLGFIASCTPNSDTGTCIPAVATAAPLANSLGMGIDTSCGTGEESDDDCVHNLLHTYAKTSSAPILLVWDAAAMDDLLENLGMELPDADNEDDEDDEEGQEEEAVGTHPDVILTKIKGSKLAESSMNCTGIDGTADGSDTIVYTPSHSRRRRSLHRRRFSSESFKTHWDLGRST
ncbi:uncharacterized protein EV420DRAFT_1633778 [Desarmillaria tabescens]|uniref:Uncharacterized protein n=1 Tax=Armillaria tabescens TaxID=1929756 RepID=A0AA39NPD6_ARMTA|nr:uncharacterized protein EV420DRAFT_1633778 [Desarmillaria tabescens]KAK0469366.1 hypothetical protein EV420DRAFT_1633778 [Desarmillaria tabescens]